MIETRTAPAVAWLLVTAIVLSMSAGFGFARAANAQVSESTVSKDEARAVLSAYATDLSQAASQGKLEAVQGFDVEVDSVIGSLLATRFSRAMALSSATARCFAAAFCLATPTILFTKE